MNARNCRRLKLPIAILLCATIPFALQAQELRYKPVNPSFGGNPFNSGHLISLANSQNQYEAPERERRSPIEDFANTVERALVSQVSREVADRILGENAQESGSFALGNTTIDFQQQEDQTVVVTIQDTVEGASTTIKLPAPQF